MKISEVHAKLDKKCVIAIRCPKYGAKSWNCSLPLIVFLLRYAFNEHLNRNIIFQCFCSAKRALPYVLQTFRTERVRIRWNFRYKRDHLL